MQPGELVDVTNYGAYPMVVSQDLTTSCLTGRQAIKQRSLGMETSLGSTYIRAKCMPSVRTALQKVSGHA